jgi:flagellar hook-associated protein 1 FlgK
MWGTFGSIEIALRALQAQRLALDVIAHNIANASTPGYSRQTARLETAPPYPWPGLTASAGAGQLGTGVEVGAVDRLRDAFTDLQLRQQYTLSGYYTVLADGYAQVEAVFNEPSDSGLNEQLGRFWGAWQELSLNPQDTAIRTSVIQSAQNLASLFNGMVDRLRQLQRDLNFRVTSKVAEINELAERIARLNVQIGQVRGTGQNPNDLLDARDRLIDELSRIVRAAFVEDSNGQVTVYIGGRMLVSGDQAFSLSIVPGPGGFAQPVWADGAPVTFGDGSGELKALIDLRDAVIPGKVAELNDLAGALANAVNTIHRAGWGLDNSTGLDFFVFTAGDEAATLAVNPVVAVDPNKVAAAQGPDSPGDGRNALAVAQVQYQKLMAANTATLGEYYQQVVGRLGLEARGADDQKANQEVVRQYLEARRESFSGVSLDEEAAKLVLYQRAFEAAARSLSVLDEILDQLINRTGIVGR